LCSPTSLSCGSDPAVAAPSGFCSWHTFTSLSVLGAAAEWPSPKSLRMKGVFLAGRGYVPGEIPSGTGSVLSSIPRPRGNEPFLCRGPTDRERLCQRCALPAAFPCLCEVPAGVSVRFYTQNGILRGRRSASDLFASILWRAGPCSDMGTLPVSDQIRGVISTPCAMGVCREPTS